MPEFAMATPEGARGADVVWIRPGRWEEMQKTGDPTTLGPQISVEVRSRSIDPGEMAENRAPDLEVEAEEVWIVDLEGCVRVYGEEKFEHSRIVPEIPETVSK